MKPVPASPRPRGAGPAHVKIFGGGPHDPTYSGAASLWWVHFALCSVPRLQILSALLYNGPLRTQKLATLIGVPYVSVLEALWGLRTCHLVQPRSVDAATTRLRGKGGAWRLEWSATPEGWTYLFRYARTTKSLAPYMEDGPALDRWAGVAPWLAPRHAEHSLLRPAPLAIAHYLRWLGPRGMGRFQEDLGLHRSTIGLYLRRWESLGWAARVAVKRHPFSRRLPNSPDVLWKCTRHGGEAMDHHVAALLATAGLAPFYRSACPALMARHSTPVIRGPRPLIPLGLPTEPEEMEDEVWPTAAPDLEPPTQTEEEYVQMYG